MSRRIIWVTSIVVVLLVISLIGAGNYFYSVAINRSYEPIELYSGEEAEPVNALLEERKQAKLEEVLKWTENQAFDYREIISEDGLRLKARYLKNENSDGKAVILAHGYKGSSEQMADITKFYFEQGFDVLKPDARGHGESEGDYIGYGWHERKDYLEWIDFLREEQHAKSVFLHGFSMGAATVLMTSGERLPAEVKGIIADSGYTTVAEELAHQLKHMYKLPPVPLIQVTSAITKIRAGYTFGEASALEAVKNNKLPLLIIHGDKDELVPTEMGNRLYDAAKGDKDIWIVPGAGHTDAYTVAEEEYQQRLQEFMASALK
ncbi:alpha/beta fold hydrolase [Mesobacillus harenae]|uniref:alpha/beta fold hydrolase n=1 Tax=Mesobacillus harenae TaxID=2213203 RepID=UPI001580858D